MNRFQEARSSSFQQLKPICIKLSEVALRQGQADPKELNSALDALANRLRALPFLDAKLADYAFFPLSYVIKNAGSIQAASLALAVRCLELLVRRGWQATTDAALVKELLVFLVIQISKAQQNDLQLALLGCLEALIQCMNDAVAGILNDEQKETTAIAGQLLDTLLGIIKDSPAIEIQIQAATVLEPLISILTSQELLRMFLPGVVSQLSNILRPQTRRVHRVLVAAINSLDVLIRNTLSDLVMREKTSEEDESWKRATSSQLLLALSNMVAQRSHDRSEVLDALSTICTTILDECRDTLENCRALMLETLCMISSRGRQRAQINLDMLAANESINSTLQDLVYKWVQSLPRRLQSRDDQQAEQTVSLICEGYRALQESDSEITSLNAELLQAIENSAQLLLEDKHKSKQVDDLPDLSVRDLVLSKPPSEMKTLGSLDTPYLRLLDTLVHRINPLAASGQTTYANEASLASLWMLTRSLAYSLKSNGIVQEFVSSPVILGQFLDLALEQALTILVDNTDEIDWRSKALALELVTLVSSQEKDDFRTSLIDALFPLVELVGASDPFLRQYAITSLNAVSLNCGYTGPGDMIVQNVDYLVNAVSLKFNTFDVSPQAVQVLVIMLELSGPALIPYLDDLVDSIFGALAAYHGYPRLVEVMFSALAAIVKHGSSASSSIMTVPRIEHGKKKSQFTAISEIPTIINEIRYPPTQEEDTAAEEQTQETDTSLQTTTPSTDLDKPEKPPKVYSMVESVLRLSQHYLTHQEPYLRQRLLELVSVGCVSLSRNEELFLPLINDIWPVVIQRLYDQEAIVALAAMDTLSAIFTGAGDFVTTRVQDEWIPIRNLFRNLDAKATTERKGKGGRGMFAYTERLFDGMVKMLLQLILHVRVKAEMEDDLFDMLGPLVRQRSDARDALDILNADALWLVMEAPVFKGITPALDGFTFAEVNAM